MISPKWSNIAKCWLNNPNGIHCHWCKHIKTKDGEAKCGKMGCKHNDGERIRSWDGYIAEKCEHFRLDKWYDSDKNYNKTFRIKKEKK